MFRPAADMRRTVFRSPIHRAKNRYLFALATSAAPPSPSGTVRPTGRAWSALSREAVTGGRALITRIRTVWTQVDLRRVRAGVRIGRWRDAGAGVDLRIGRFILARVVLRTRCATRLPTTTAIPAAPNWGTRCAWDDVNPGGHRQCDAIRGRPDPGGRN